MFLFIYIGNRRESTFPSIPKAKSSSLKSSRTIFEVILLSFLDILLDITFLKILFYFLIYEERRRNCFGAYIYLLSKANCLMLMKHFYLKFIFWLLMIKKFSIPTIAVFVCKILARITCFHPNRNYSFNWNIRSIIKNLKMPNLRNFNI